MGNVFEFRPPEVGEDYQKLAVEKIASELASFKGDRYGQAVKDFVASTLTNFCNQNVRFAEVVYKTKRTLSDCCAAIMKGCGQHISDIDVYRSAVRYYFPNSEIVFQMNITFTGDAPSQEEMDKAAEKPVQTEKQPKKAAPKTTPKPATKPEPKKPAPKQKQKEQPKPQEPEMLQLTLF